MEQKQDISKEQDRADGNRAVLRRFSSVKREIPYEDLERHFRVPKAWRPGKQAYFDHYRRIPRKMKKDAKKRTRSLGWLSLGQRLWYLQGIRNPDHNRFLAKKVVEAS